MSLLLTWNVLKLLVLEGVCHVSWACVEMKGKLLVLLVHHLLVRLLKSWHLLNRSSRHSFMSTWASHFNVLISQTNMWVWTPVLYFGLLLQNLRVLEATVSDGLLLKWVLVLDLRKYWCDVLNTITTNRSSSEEIIRIFLVLCEEITVWVLFFVFAIWTAFCLSIPCSLINELRLGRLLHLRLVIRLLLNGRLSDVHLVVFLVHNSIKFLNFVVLTIEFIFIFLK